MEKRFIPLSVPNLGRELEYITRAIETEWYLQEAPM